MKNNFLKTGIKASSLSGKIVSSFLKNIIHFISKIKIIEIWFQTLIFFG